jgi:hypothetical protein
MAQIEVNQTEKVEAESGEDLVAATGMDLEDAMSIMEMEDSRAERKGDHHVIVFVTEWLANQRGGSQYLLAEACKEVSKDAYVLEGAYDINMTEIAQNGSTTFTKCLHEVDETDGDYVDEKGVTFVPRSQTEQIVEIVE